MDQWQLELKQSITNYLELFKLLDLDAELFTGDQKTNKLPLLATKSFIRRIRHNDIHDPLLLQILPSKNEAITAINYLEDPLQEKTFNKIPGLIHKYPGRVLILGSKSCAIHCRYCFRQNFHYNSNIAGGKNLDDIINYIAVDRSIYEVILSGGDPLIASNNYFKKLFSLLEPIHHLTTIRIHSRIPIILPSRLEAELLDILLNSRFNIVLVTHSNHPNEINQEVAEHFKILHNTKIVLLNQSVLLKNINDNSDVLATLSKKLFEIKIMPYYLHMLDHVSGTTHFDVDLPRAKQIFSELAGKVPGYLLPRLVTEHPGAISKIFLA